MNALQRIREDMKPHSISVEKQHYYYLDIIKILSAFLVVFYHYSFYSLDYGFSDGVAYYPNITRVIMSFAACSVPLFFMVNGALMFSRKRKWDDVYYKAAKIAVIVLCFRFLGFPDWFFKTLIFLYIIYPLFNYCWEKRRGVYYSIIGLLMVFPFLYNQATVILKVYTEIDYQITGAKTMYSIVYFLLGNILFRKRAFSSWQSIILMVLGMVLLLFDCVVLTNFQQTISDGVNGAFPTLGALFLSVGVFEFFKNNDFKKLEWLSFFSQGILPIYLFHMFVMKYCFAFLGKPTSIVTALAGSILICTSCCGLGWVMKRTPILCFLSKI